MKTVIIQSYSQSTLKRIIEFIKYFWGSEISIDEKSEQEELAAGKGHFKSSKDFRELAGIWKNRNISQDELRKRSWRHDLM